MCARYTMKTGAQTIRDLFSLAELPPEAPGMGIFAPTDIGLILTADEDGHRHGQLARWGLVPFWSKDPTGGSRMINARSETVFEKPAFRESILKRRCLVPADSFYEWTEASIQAGLFGENEPPKKGKTRKQPHRIGTRGHEPFAMAGLFDRWKSADGEVLTTYTVLTCPPNALAAELHDRMPVILPKEAYEDWLDSSLKDAASISLWMTPYPAEDMVSVAVPVDEPFPERGEGPGLSTAR